MIIKCWGARGSIPVSGKDYLRFGGNTTCMEIRTTDGHIIIIDAGSGIRELGKSLLAENSFKYTLLFTHAHWDHIMGFPFFRPIYDEHTSITFYGCSFAQESIKEMLSRTMVSPHFPVNFNDIKAEFTYNGVCRDSFFIGHTKVSPIFLSHPNQGLGYKLEENGRTFVFITDNELTYRHFGGLELKDYVEFSTGADLLVHDSEYIEEEYERKKTWGHSVYKDSLRVAIEAKVKRFGLFHHNQERTDDMVDEIVLDCKKIIQQQNSLLDCFAVYEGQVIEL